MADFFQFLEYVWVGTREAMKLNPRVFEIVSESVWSRWVILVIAMLGGASLLLGQSAILFVNRVKPSRFALSLVLNGVIFTAGLVIWALAIWLTGSLMFAEEPRLGDVLRMVGLGAAPYVFGFLILIPYAGDFIEKVLSAWSFIIVLAGIAYLYHIEYWSALLCVGIGWVLVNVLTRLIGRPIIALRDAIWKRVTGSEMDARVSDVLTGMIGDTSGRPPSSGAAG
jgi:hypothetical protein